MGTSKTKFDQFWDDVFVILMWAVVVGFIFFIGQILTGCASGQVSIAQPPPPKYELLLTGTIDGNSFQGIAVGSKSSHHDMTIHSAVAVNYFTMQSCHRSIQFNDVIKVRWYDWANDSKSFNWAYDEAPTIEDSGDCILRFCAFSNTVGAAPVACAIVDFKSDKYTLPGKNICNGAAGNTSGSAVCHTQVGLIERFQFAEPVMIAPQVIDAAAKAAPYWIKDQCVGKFLDTAQTLWEYQMPSSECVVIFDTIAKPHRRAKLTAIPYDIAKYPGGK